MSANAVTVSLIALLLLLASASSSSSGSSSSNSQADTHQNDRPSVASTVLGGVRDFFGRTVTGIRETFIPKKSKMYQLLSTLESCTLVKDKGWTDRDLGDFTINSTSAYCSSNCTRSVICCAPQKPQEINVKLLHFDQRNQSYPLNLTSDADTARRLVRQNDNLVWFIHGFKDNIYKNPVFNQTKDAYLRRGYDVVMVDWSGGNLAYFQSLANVRLVGALVGRMIVQLDVADRSTCVGFSLGSHVCGEVGSWVRAHSHGVVRKCIGVDPAGPGFDGCSDQVRLDKSDCGVVTSVHTSQFENLGSLIDNEGLGTSEKVGHCDFWANEGLDQPKCKSSLFGKSCSHARGMEYFLSQVSHVCNFTGHEAECGGGEECTRTRRRRRVAVPWHRSGPHVHAPHGGWRHPTNESQLHGRKILTRMPVSPDDSCTSDYDMDYQFDTKANAPFC